MGRQLRSVVPLTIKCDINPPPPPPPPRVAPYLVLVVCYYILLQCCTFYYVLRTTPGGESTFGMSLSSRAPLMSRARPPPTFPPFDFGYIYGQKCGQLFPLHAASGDRSRALQDSRGKINDAAIPPQQSSNSNSSSDIRLSSPDWENGNDDVGDANLAVMRKKTERKKILVFKFP